MIRCPMCGSLEHFVMDKRNPVKTDTIYRRRHCKNCQHRFSTSEVVEGQTYVARPVITPEWVQDMRRKGYKFRELAEMTGRSVTYIHTRAYPLSTDAHVVRGSNLAPGPMPTTARAAR